MFEANVEWLSVQFVTSAVLPVLGAVLLTATAYDLVRTVFDVGQGGGPITGRASKLLWQGVLALRARGVSHRTVERLGLAVVISVVGTWLVAIWMGWTLVLSGDPDAVVETGTSRPATFWERAYFAVTSQFVLGNGEFQGGTTGWRFVVGATSVTGLLVVTLSITYLLPIIDAASDRRRLAGTIFALGDTPQEIVLSVWNGSNVAELHDHLTTLLPSLTSMGQRHLAYPVLHFFHSSSRRTAIAPALAALDEALGIIRYGLEATERESSSFTAVRRAIGEFLPTLQLFPIGDEVPPTPRLDRLRACGVPMRQDEEFASSLEADSRRRCLLLATVREDGWEWGDVIGDDDQLR
ncbi:MAG: two pore domain potassium channel family protein [Actinomycetota bacterium]|nr:two pore domain potassium channel family protein [Actinomycetota bacterium]